MITPGYSLTASERVLPRFALDFTTAVLDPRVTVTRTGNTATVTNSDGSVSIVNANLPRFDYSNGVCQGLLLEETRTNILVNSVFAGAVAGTPGTAPTNWLDLLATGTITSVTSGLYAAGNVIRISNTGTRRAFYRTETAAASTAYAYTIFITVNSTASVGYPRISDCMNLFGGPAGSTVAYFLNGAAATSSTALAVGQTHRVTAVLSVGATAGTVEVRWGLGIGSAIDADVSIQMPQFEVGTFPTSYIPTTTASVQRNFDAASVSGSNFTSWYVAGDGTLKGEAIFFGLNKGRSDGLVSLSNGTANESIALFRNGSANNIAGIMTDNGTAPATYIVPMGTQPVKTAMAFATNNTNFALNGVSQTATTSCTLPTVDRLIIGAVYAAGDFPTNGWVQKIYYWPQRLLDREIAAITK